MKYPRPDSALQRFFLGTRYVRIVGNAVVKSYLATVDGGIRLRLRTTGGDSSIAEEVFRDRVYERYFKPEIGDTVIDAGAHLGCFSLRSALLVGDGGQVIAFEPSRGNYSLLAENIAMNGFRNVRPLNIGLSRQEGEAELFLASSTGSNSVFARKDKRIRVTGKEKVRLRQLDDIMKELKLARLDFLKLDAEGAELDILEGSAETLSSCHPKIAGEAHPAFSASADSILQYLSRFGYRGRAHRRGGRQEMFYAWVDKDGAS